MAAMLETIIMVQSVRISKAAFDLYGNISRSKVKGGKIVFPFFGRPFVKRFALCYRTVVCLSCLSVSNVGVLWTNSLTDQDETWHAGRPPPWPHCVTWGPSSPSPKGAQPPIFGPYPLW